jgi:hypothetical protein
MEVLEIEEAPSKQRDPRTAANSSTWKTCVGYALLAGIVGLEFLRAADQTLKVVVVVVVAGARLKEVTRTNDGRAENPSRTYPYTQCDSRNMLDFL